ncbi:N-acetylmuramoyl-L-alanine amidase [Ferrovibrio sp.]|uniref:N-acetylmuramoyl-L-alanine amidase family protein n=1 Tax=Ferrovibrio sp. TaxID=1917215 RepID=UPI0035120B58
MVRCRGAQEQGLSRCRTAGFDRFGGISIKYLLSIVFFCLLGLPAAGAAPVRIEGLQLGLNAGLTRLVIEASAPLEGELSAAPDGLGLILTLPGSRWAAPAPARHAAGLVAGLGLPVEAGGAVSLGLDLVEPVLVERAFRLPPQGGAGGAGHRLVIDLRPADPQAWQAAFATPLALPLAGASDILPPPAAADRPRLVVLDPGHGGQDPGAISASGRYEKDVTLAMARAVAAKLQQTGRYRVVLTRDRDRFVRLGDRVALARKQEADLFLSIHADSLAADRATRGASVYTRAEDASDTEAEALALRENRADQLADSAPARDLDEVVSILLDLASRDTPRLSGRFAGLLTASLGDRMPLRRNALRAANFKVLSAPDIPSALLELGYLSNPGDEALLFSEAGRAELAAAVVAAIDRFFGLDER